MKKSTNKNGDGLADSGNPCGWNERAQPALDRSEFWARGKVCPLLGIVVMVIRFLAAVFAMTIKET